MWLTLLPTLLSPLFRACACSFAKVMDRAAVQQFIDSAGTKVAVICRFLGLDRVKDTIVGNDMMRGSHRGRGGRWLPLHVCQRGALCHRSAPLPP